MNLFDETKLLKNLSLSQSINIDLLRKFWTALFAMLGFCLAILAVVASKPNLPVYEARYLIALMIIALAVSVLVNQRVGNPYLDILHIVFFFFYVTRAIALLIFPLSSDLLMPPLPVGAVSSATVFLIFAFISLVIGCHLFLRNIPIELGALSSIEISFVKAVLWIATTIVLANSCYYAITFTQCDNVYAGISISILAILQSVFDSWRSLILLAPMILLYGAYLSNAESLLVIGNLILFGGIGIFIGQKSTILQIILYLLFPLILKLRSFERVQLRNLMVYSVLLLVLAMVGFMLGKLMRIVQINHYGCMVDHAKIETLSQAGAMLRGQGVDGGNSTVSWIDFNQILLLVNSFSYRAGYFDFFVEKYSNPAYFEIVTLKQYFMAVVDKVTPGFDLFNVPFVSRSIYYAHHPEAVPGAMTNSEQITVFGEAGLLFGWGALIFLPFVCWLIGLLHQNLHRLAGKSRLARNLIYLFTLQLFYYWIEGMGLDMLFTLHLLYTGVFMTVVAFLAWGVLAGLKLLLRWQTAR